MRIKYRTPYPLHKLNEWIAYMQQSRRDCGGLGPEMEKHLKALLAHRRKYYVRFSK